MFEIRIRIGREKALLRGHPWIYSGSIQDVSIGHDSIEIGETVRVVDSSGSFLAWGAYSPVSQIRVRVWSRKSDDVIGAQFLASKLKVSLELRESLINRSETNAFRIVYAESDGLPGFIVDRYADTLVIQCLSSGAEYWRDMLVNLLHELTGCERIYERSDAPVRALEGLPSRTGLLTGSDDFDNLMIQENDLNYWVDIRRGQKTGFYLDQRINRLNLRSLADGRSVLDCFAYTGGFSLSALAGGARQVVAVESSKESLELGRSNLGLNPNLSGEIEWVEGDVFEVLRAFRDKNEKFDLIVLDPPKFAPTASQVQRAARGYKDINLLAFKLLNQNGILVTFSCSGGIREELFQKIVAGAALDARVDAKIVDRLGQGPDHPVALNFPEGAYLKGFVVQI